MSLLTPLRRNRQAPAENIGPRGTHAHLSTGPTGTWAWFVMGTVDWQFRSTTDRARVMGDHQFRWADLAGHQVHLRTISRPVSYAHWAKRLDAISPKHLADPAGAQAWTDYLHAQQGYVAAAGLHIVDDYIGVRIATKGINPAALHRLLDTETSDSGSIVAARCALTHVTETVARPGFEAKAITARQLAHLLHTSAAIGVPAPATALAGVGERMGQVDLDSITGQVELAAPPYSPSVEVHAMREGGDVTRHTTVLTLGAMRPRHPSRATFYPWMAYARAFPFPTEWSAILDVVPSAKMEVSAQRLRRTAEDQAAHYREHGEQPPERTKAQIAAAKRVEEEVVNGTAEEGVRLFGQWRLAVTANTADETRFRAAHVINAYAQDQGVTVVHTRAQADLYDEFMPGAGRARNGGHTRVLSARYASTAVPNISADLGDGIGPVIGRAVAGSTGSVCIDPTWGPRNTTSGLILVASALGGGKSTLAGLMAYPMVLRGNRTIIRDPSGPLARMTTMPAIARVSRHIDLASAQPGILNPYTMVFDPTVADYPGAAERAVAESEAVAERRDLLIETFMGLLDPRLVASLNGVLSRIEAAAQDVEAHYGQSPWAVVEQLRHIDDTGAEIARALTTSSGLKGSALVFPSRALLSKTDPSVELDTAVLTVLTMRGLPTPAPGAPRESWSRSERMMQPVIALSSRLASRAMYEDREPKFIVTDELGQAVGSGDGFKASMTRQSVDSRKHNTGCMVLGQNPAQVEAIGEEITNLAGLVFVGLMRDADTARKAVRFLGVPDDHGYERLPLSFPNGRGQSRHFMLRDWRNRVGTVQLDLSHLPELAAVLDTDPGAADDADHDEFAMSA